MNRSFERRVTFLIVGLCLTGWVSSVVVHAVSSGSIESAALVLIALQGSLSGLAIYLYRRWHRQSVSLLTGRILEKTDQFPGIVPVEGGSARDEDAYAGVMGALERIRKTFDQREATLKSDRKMMTDELVLLDRQFGHLQGVVDQIRKDLDAKNSSAAGAGSSDGEGFRFKEVRGLCDDVAGELMNLRQRTSGEMAELECLEKDMVQFLKTGLAMQEVSRNLSFIASEGSMSVQETVAAIQEMSGLIETLEMRARESATMSSRTVETISRRGMMSVINGAEGIGQIEASVSTLTTAIEKVGERSSAIDKILLVIRDVIEQTRLLSFNAQILAAQAGDQNGRAFSVVADEIQELSEKTEHSAHGISEIVNALRKEIQGAVTELSGLSRVTEDGSARVMTIGSVLREILLDAQKSAEFAREIEATMTGQAGQLNGVLSAAQIFQRMTHDVTVGVQDQDSKITAMNEGLGKLKRIIEALRAAIDLQSGDMRAALAGLETIKSRVNLMDVDRHQKTASSAAPVNHVRLAEIDELVHVIRDVTDRLTLKTSA